MTTTAVGRRVQPRTAAAAPSAACRQQDGVAVAGAEGEMLSRGVVLVADDDSAFLGAMALALRRLGYEVCLVENGEEALTMAHAKQPDVVLLDVGMPGMNGYEVCQRLKMDHATRLIPVIFLSGRKNREARLEGLGSGATDFLTKPFDLTELEIKVRNLVSFRRLTRDLNTAEEIVFSLARMVEARDRETGHHCERLAELSVRLGSYLGLSGKELEVLRRASYLHDIGKVATPDSVLLKPGELSQDEWEIMRRHPTIGAEICLPIKTLRHVIPIIRCHHEKGDGSGYPDNLHSNQITYLTKIFQVADVYDALTNDRCYHKALGMAQGLVVLREEAERGWWDRHIVAALCQLLEDQGSA